MSILPDHLSVDFLPLIDNELFLVGKTNPYKSSKKLSPEVINELPLIYREEGSGTRFMMEEYLKSKEIFSEKKVVLTSNEAVKQALMAGLGYSIMPLIGIRHEIARNALEIIPLKGLPIKTKWYLVWLKNKKFSPVAEAYLNYLRLNSADLFAKNFAN
jgi:DNA-binding transcriptional LysR family regulator